MRYRTLGPLTVSSDGQALNLGGPKQRLVLAVLLAHVGEVMPPDRLIDGVWGNAAPARARHTLQAYVSELRKVLDDPIEWRSHGYLLAVDPDRVDWVQFERLVASGRRALPDTPAEAAGLLADALALWRGEPFADLRDAPGLQGDVRRLEQLRLTALEHRIEADLALGRHHDVEQELQTLTREWPFRETFRAQHMIAVYRCGRQAEALRTFERTRSFLAEEMGVDPSPELQRVHQMVLRQDTALDLPPEVTSAAGAGSEPDRAIRGLELRGVIGRGEATTVHRAYQPSMGREVAVKVIDPEVANDPGFIRHFEARARKVANLEHPHVLRLHDFWRGPDGAFLVLPWARGGSLADALDRGRLSLAATLRIVGQVGAALSYAHRRDVFHGAVTPTNVLLDEDGNAYLADFSVASPGSRRAHRAPAEAPELAEEPASVAADVAAFGRLVHRALGGQVVPGQVPGDGRLPPIAEMRDDVPVELDGVLQRATASQPADRHARIDDLLRDLRGVLGADVVGVAARPEDEEGDVRIRIPYKGLRAFQEADAEDFFGRDDLTERLLETLLDRRLVAVVGPSGSGKSSLVRAGMIPAVRSGALPDSDTWLITDMFPGAYPFEELAAALSRVAVERIDGMVDELIADDRGLLRVTKQAMPGEDTQLLLVIDQFEELFSMVDDPAVRRLFLDSLVVVTSDPRSRVRVVITLRADFFDRPLEHHLFGSLLEAGLVPVTVPSAEGLALAISRPARLVGLELEQGLVAQVVRDAEGQPGALPLMQHALAELARRPRGRLLTSEAYVQAGGVTGALGQRAEELFASLTATEQRAAEQVFLRLVTVTEGAEDARRRVRRTELAALDISAATLDQVLGQFGAHRLLSFDLDPVTRGATVEVAHEALLHGWGRLRGWVDDRREDLLLHRRLDAAVREWEDADRDAGFLLAGGRLDQFEAWTASDALPLTSGERAFLSASRARQDAVARRSRHRRHGLIALLSLLTATAVVLAIVAVDRARAVQTRALITAATTTLDTDPELALVLAIEAAKEARGDDRHAAIGVLHETLLAAPVVRAVPGTGALAWSPSTDLIATLAEGTEHMTVSIREGSSGEEVASVTPGHGHVTGVAWSGDGRLLAITSDEGPTVVWEVATEEVMAQIPPARGGHRFPSFGAGDRYLAVSDLPVEGAASRTDSVVIWDVERGTAVRRIGLDTGAYGTHLSPADPLLLVSEPETRSASIWDVRTGEQVVHLGDQGQQIDVVRFSPDGSRAAVMGRDRVEVWDVATAEVVADLPAVVGARDLEWSPDGTLIATAGGDAVVSIVDVEQGEEVRTLEGAPSAISDLEFGPDGRQLAALWDEVRIWDLHRPTGAEVAAHPVQGPITSAAWTPDRRRVVTIRSEGRADVIDVIDAGSGTRLASISHAAPSTPPRGPRPPPAKVVVSPDGRWIAATVHGTSTGIVDADRLELVTVLRPGGTPGSFSADSQRLVVGDSSAAYIYETSTWAHTATIRNRDPSPFFTWYYDAEFHPDGDVVFVADSNRADAQLTAWEVTGEPEQIAAFPLGTAATTTSLSADGRRVAAGDVMSGAVRVWDVEPVLAGADPESATVLDIDAGDFLPGAVLDHDGTTLVTVLRGELAVWDVDRAERLYAVDLPDGVVNEPELAGDGSRLLVPAATVVHELTLDPEELLDIAESRVTRPLDDQECRTYLGGGCPTRR